jgi:hypothetical protein
MKGLKLTYQTSREVNVSAAEIKGWIMLGLKDKSYKVKKVENNAILFDGQPGRSFKRLGRGKIEINGSVRESFIVLEYYIDLIAPLVVFAITLVFGIRFGVYSFPIIVALALSIQEFIRKSVWNGVANRLLDDILNNYEYESTEHH